MLSEHLPEHLMPLLGKSRREALADVAFSGSLIGALSHYNKIDAWLPSHCLFGVDKLRDLQFCALLLCLRYWSARTEELSKFDDKDKIRPSNEAPVLTHRMPEFTTKTSALQRFTTPRVCRLSVPCGGGKTAIIAWLCALRGGNILVGTDVAANALHILFVLLKQTNIAEYMNVRIVRGTEDGNQLDTSGMDEDDKRLLERHVIMRYMGDPRFNMPLVPDNSIGNIIIVDSMLIRLDEKSSIPAKKTLRAALSLLNWNLMIFDEVDRFFTNDTRKPFEEGFQYAKESVLPKALSMRFNVPDAVMMSGTWREGDESNTREAPDWLKRCGPMLMRIKTYDLAKQGILAMPHFHLVVCKDVPESKFGFYIPQINRTNVHKEDFTFGLSFGMKSVIERIVEMQSLVKGKTMIFSTLENETRALATLFPSAILVTGSTDTASKTILTQKFRQENSQYLATRNVWITTSIGGRGTDISDVTAIILIGGEASDTKWQQIGRGLRAWVGAQVCEVWDLVPERVKWAQTWLNSSDGWFESQKHTISRLKNIIIEGFESHINIIESNECILNIDKEIDRICERRSVKREAVKCCTDNVFFAANHALCVALNEFPKPNASTDVASSSSAATQSKSGGKRKKNEKGPWEHVGRRFQKIKSGGGMTNNMLPKVSAKSAAVYRDRGINYESQRKNVIKKHLGVLIDVEFSEVDDDWILVQVKGVYDIDADTDLEKLERYRANLHDRAVEAAKQADIARTRIVDSIWLKYYQHESCEFMKDKFPEI